MADPRAVIRQTDFAVETKSFTIDAVTILYLATAVNGSVSVGLAASLAVTGLLKLAADGEAVIGKLLAVESDNVALVQTDGQTTLPAGTAAVLTHGKAIVGDLLVAAPGYIREVNTAVAAELGVMNGTIINNSVTTAVVVDL